MKTKPTSKPDKLLGHATDYFGDRPLVSPEIYIRLFTAKKRAKTKLQRLSDLVKKIFGLF
jgi:hypothetical protein